MTNSIFKSIEKPNICSALLVLCPPPSVADWKWVRGTTELHVYVFHVQVQQIGSEDCLRGDLSLAHPALYLTHRHEIDINLLVILSERQQISVRGKRC